MYIYETCGEDCQGVTNEEAEFGEFDDIKEESKVGTPDVHES